jgi:hypothetical protein
MAATSVTNSYSYSRRRGEIAKRWLRHLDDAKRIVDQNLRPYGDPKPAKSVDEAKSMLDDERLNPGKYENEQIQLANDLFHPPASSDDDDGDDRKRSSKQPAETPARQAALKRLAAVFTPKQMDRIRTVFDRQPRMYDNLQQIQNADLLSRVKSMIVIDPTCSCGHEFETESEPTDNRKTTDTDRKAADDADSAAKRFESEFAACLKRYIPAASDELITKMLDAIYKEEYLDGERPPTALEPPVNNNKSTAGSIPRLAFDRELRSVVNRHLPTAPAGLISTMADAVEAIRITNNKSADTKTACEPTPSASAAADPTIDDMLAGMKTAFDKPKSKPSKFGAAVDADFRICLRRYVPDAVDATIDDMLAAMYGLYETTCRMSSKFTPTAEPSTAAAADESEPQPQPKPAPIVRFQSTAKQSDPPKWLFLLAVAAFVGIVWLLHKHDAWIRRQIFGGIIP